MPLFSLVSCSVVFATVAPTLCDPMDCSTPGLPAHHQLPDFTQTHIHRVNDAISHLILYRPLILLPSIFPSIRVFSNESALRIRWPKYWSFSFSISPPVNIQDWFPLGLLVWSSCCPRDSQESSPTPQFESITSLALSLLYGPTLTSVYDYWKNHSFD